MRYETRLMKPFSGLWQSKSPQAEPQPQPQPKAVPHVPSLIHHEGVDYKVLRMDAYAAICAQIEQLKSQKWSLLDRLWFCAGVGVCTFAAGYAVSQSVKPGVQIVEKPMMVDRPVMVDRPIPIDRNCFFFCK
jgi:hypothetical protein